MPMLIADKLLPSERRLHHQVKLLRHVIERRNLRGGLLNLNN